MSARSVILPYDRGSRCTFEHSLLKSGSVPVDHLQREGSTVSIMLATKTGIKAPRGTPNPLLRKKMPVIPPVDENVGRLLA
jgi:hypothetical protein